MMHNQVHFSVVFPQWSERRMRQRYKDMTSLLAWRHRLIAEYHYVKDPT
jgi:hypothetical protein